MFHATTILAYKGKNKSVIGGDGQVSFGNTVLKGNAVKIRKLNNGKVLAGFAGSTADAFNLFDMFENLLQSSKGDLLKAAIDFSKEWRKDKYLRKLEAMMLVLDRNHIFFTFWYRRCGRTRRWTNRSHRKWWKLCTFSC